MRTPALPRASFDVVAAELGDPGVLDRIRHRVRLRRITNASPRPGVPMDVVIARQHDPQDVDRILPVLGESTSQIRVVIEDDDARLALWVDRADTWQTVLVPIQLADSQGRAAVGSGAWLTAGAAIDVAADVPGDRRDRRRVQLRDDAITVAGTVPAAVVGNVWLADDDDPEPPQLARTSIESFRPPVDDRPLTRFAPHTAIRAAPRADAPVIAVVESAELVGSLISRETWAEVEVIRRHARIRGHVLATELVATTGDLQLGGTGSGSGFGMSHSHRVEVPTGTCLFEQPEGEVIGVQLAPSTRHGERKSAREGWSKVYVDTGWAVAALYLRATGEDPPRPAWESCTKGPHHR
ncbi:MAG: hypothetical protein M3680_10890 [Myxococcota bacterium]|nr:hypothetical protein [Myxococcota bacterium]